MLAAATDQPAGESCFGSESITAHYDRRYYETHLLPRVRAAVQQRLHAIGKYLGEADSVLDFGCSDGELLLAAPGSSKAGIEVNPFSRSIARDRGIDVRASIKDFKGAGFSRIISCHCLEHVPSPADSLNELRELLTNDGRLVLNLPLNDCRDRRQLTWDPDDMNQHLHAWTPRILGNLLHACGFSPEVVVVHRYVYPSWPQSFHSLADQAPGMYHLIARAYGAIRARHQLVAVAGRR